MAISMKIRPVQSISLISHEDNDTITLTSDYTFPLLEKVQ